MPTEQSPLVGKGGPGLARQTWALMGVIAPALLGNMLEFYEFAAYLFVTPYITANFFASRGDFWLSFGVWFGFAISFAVRPFGGVLFGYIGDRYGRRLSLMLSVAGMIVCTAGIGFLPNTACCGNALGLFGLVMLLLLKICQGLCVGGELIVTAVFAVEAGGTPLVATATGITYATATSGMLIAELVVFTVESATTEEQMLAWGWRIPFLLALPWGLVAVMLRLRLKESPAFTAHLEEKEKRDAKPEADSAEAELVSPLALVWREHRLAVFLGIPPACAFATVLWGSIMYPRDFLVDAGIRDEPATLGATMVALLCVIATEFLCGTLYDRVGIWRACLVWSCAVVVAVWPLWCLLVLPGQAWGSFVAMLLLGMLAGCGVCVACLGLELFPVPIRATGFGIVWNVAQALGAGPAPFVAKAVWGILRDAEPEGTWWVNTSPALWPVLTGVCSCAALLLLRHAALRGRLQPTHIRHHPYM